VRFGLKEKPNFYEKSLNITTGTEVCPSPASDDAGKLIGLPCIGCSTRDAKPGSINADPATEAASRSSSDQQLNQNLNSSSHLNANANSSP
jgi:hypothetical protein